MTNPTPLPWSVHSGDVWYGEADNPNAPLFRAILGYRRWGREISRDEHEANAALIVRSVNALPALVKALESIIHQAENTGNGRLMIARTARAALAPIRSAK